jgi:hypothetical protein
LLLALLCAAAAFMAYMAVYQVDDVFIVYRYARNLAAGHGFVFNAGERVEGVTCFLWTLLLAFVAAVGLPLPAVTPVLTALCGLVTLGLLARAHAEVEARTQLAPRDLLAPALLATSPGFVYWSSGSLETVPFALLLTLAAREHARARQRPELALRSAWWLGAATLVRPETPLIAFALALELLTRGGGLRAGFAAATRWLLPIAACLVPFALFRRAYFGDFLPNTYYAKTGAPLSTLIADGLTYSGRFAASLAPSFDAFGGSWLQWLGWLLLLFLLAYGLTRRPLRAYAVVALALGCAVVLEGGDWMVLFRFWVPALPALALIAAHALLRLAAKRHGLILAAVLALACAGNGIALAVFGRNDGRGLAAHGEGYRLAHVKVGEYLRDHGAPGDAVALMDIGMIGWYAPQLNVIDITGLTDRAIARAPGGFLDKRFAVEDLFARDPRYLVVVPRFAADERIVAHPDFKRRYRLVMRLNYRAGFQPPGEYWLHLMERRSAQ